MREAIRQRCIGSGGCVLAKLPHGGLSILELMYIFPCFAGGMLSFGKFLSSEAADMGYQRCMAFFFLL